MEDQNRTQLYMQLQFYIRYCNIEHITFLMLNAKLTHKRVGEREILHKVKPSVICRFETTLFCVWQEQSNAHIYK